MAVSFGKALVDANTPYVSAVIKRGATCHYIHLLGHLNGTHDSRNCAGFACASYSHVITVCQCIINSLEETRNASVGWLSSSRLLYIQLTN